ncbi:Lysine ketoglutarate reductase trans-splicing related 1 [Musa troglodytarum]|uniref:Lysine ketoglutarate reductase trans-splicing related 1 n=1 Tax=Musa troglodytarum TaxID=320322 RepID=A0A9E7KTX6_9LILI|nr:Lysine ketoglutarate reductase trans-splicing related 1 [Musa troglodytarum]
MHVGCAFRLVMLLICTFNTLCPQLSACRYITMEISQPGVDPSTGLTWRMTMRRRDHDVHRETEEKPGRCSDPRLPPCCLRILCLPGLSLPCHPTNRFVEIMTPVFSRDA